MESGGPQRLQAGSPTVMGARVRILVGNLPLVARAYGSGPRLRILRALRERLIAARVPCGSIQFADDAIEADLAGVWPFSGYSVPLADQFWRTLCADLGDAPIDCGKARFYPLLHVAVSGLSPHEVPQDSIDAIDPRRMLDSSQSARALRHDTALCALWLDELRAGRLRLAFQPVRRIDSRDGGVCLYHEALLRRASDPTESPAAAIQALERQGLIGRLDWSILWSVVRLLEARPGPDVACNVSALTLRSNAWWRELVRHLRPRRTVASRLLIELTETSPIADQESTQRLIHELQDIGVRVVVDDMGSGHAGLPALNDIRYDAVKIDQSLLRQARQSPAGRETLKWITQACGRGSPCIVIEGVETPDDLRLAQEVGAQAAQGYFLGMPETHPDWNFGQPCPVLDRSPEYLTPRKPPACPGALTGAK
ncbi:EAL domain-containing protein [Achromobacter denitrificans]